MTFVLHSARVASLIVLCLLLPSEDVTVYYWDWEKGSVHAGRPLDSAGVILHTRGQNSEVLFLLTFFCGLWWPLCLIFFLDWVFCLFGSCKFSLKQECYFAVCSAQRGPHSQWGYSGAFVSHVRMLCIVKKAKQTNPERRMCFWFEGSFAHKYLFDFRKLQFITKEMFGCRFPHTSRLWVFLFFFSASKWFRKMPFPNDYFAILTKVVGRRTFVELTLEAGCLLSIETSWIWWQDS